MIFGIDNSQSSHTGNRKNTFLVLVKFQLLELMQALAHQRKSLVLILQKIPQNIAESTL